MHKVAVRKFSSTPKVFQQLAHKEGTSQILEKINVVKSTRLPTGLLVVSLENNSPLSRIAAIFKAGHRYETTQTEGILHRVRNSLGLPSQNYSAITLSYETSFQGGLIECSTSRDFLTYHLRCNRHTALAALDASLTELLCHPKVDFYNMETADEAMRIDHATIRTDYPSYAIDLLHRVAYRGQTLGRSLFGPSRSFDGIGEQALRDFFAQYVTVSNGALVALGVDHDLLLEFAVERFKLPPPSDKVPRVTAVSPQAKFFGGELRKDRGGDKAIVALAMEGVSLADPKSQAVQALLGSTLGTGPRASHAFGGESRLGKAIKAASNAPFSLSSVNVSYTDSGLFGVLYACEADDSAKLAKGIVSEFRSVASQGIQEAELKAAKNRVKFDILASAEDGRSMITDLSVQAIIKPDVSAFHSPAEIVKIVDEVSLSDINQFAKKILGSKISMAAIGNLDNTPFVDDLSKL